MQPTLCHDRVIAKGALAALPAAVERHGLGRTLLLACDDATYMAAGEAAVAQLRPAHRVLPFSLGRHAQATLAQADALMEGAAGCAGILAVGSGTVNDLCKYAAFRLGVPYVSVATAASMNGYTSATASLTHQGVKQSYAALPPRAVVADLDVVAAAPKRLARAGVGDTLCRTSVEADCLLSHFLFATPYPRADFDLLRRHEPVLIDEIGRIKESDPAYLAVLMEALLDGGDVMARAGSSVTASQGEHMIAHTLEMMYGNEVGALHGELIAVTLLTMNDLHNKLLLSQPHVRPLPRDEAYFARVFNKQAAAQLVRGYARKVLDAEQCERLNGRLAREWPEMKQAIGDVVVQTLALERAFIHGNIPMKPGDLRVNPARYNAAVTYAYLTRDRFTFLDLAQMMGRRV